MCTLGSREGPGQRCRSRNGKQLWARVGTQLVTRQPRWACARAAWQSMQMPKSYWWIVRETRVLLCDEILDNKGPIYYSCTGALYAPVDTWLPLLWLNATDFTNGICTHIFMTYQKSILTSPLRATSFFAIIVYYRIFLSNQHCITQVVLINPLK